MKIRLFDPGLFTKYVDFDGTEKGFMRALSGERGVFAADEISENGACIQLPRTQSPEFLIGYTSQDGGGFARLVVAENKLKSKTFWERIMGNDAI